MVLKDRDFFRTEKTVKISPFLSSKVKETLIRDVNFLKKMKLMDYSLLIIKVNWKLFLKENPNYCTESVIIFDNQDY